MTENTREVVASAGQLQVDFSSVTGERDAIEAKSKELVREVQCMSGLSGKTNVLGTRVAELENAPRVKSSKVQTKRITAYLNVVTVQIITERALRTALI